MKRIYLALIWILCGYLYMFSQVNTQNYVRTRTMLNDVGSSYIDYIQYFDGLGRPFQEVEKKASPVTSGNPNNLITLLDYDSMGRESQSWLPIVSASDYLAPSSFKSQAPGNYSNNSRPYSLISYEKSLNLVTNEYAPGSTLSVMSSYRTNESTGNLSCNYYYVDTSGKLYKSGIYPEGRLYVTQITDEENNVSYSFVDKQGQTYLTRQINGNNKYDTYYVYDNYGQLSYVLPPLAHDNLVANASYDVTNRHLKDYAYIYRYDNRNRCISKKLPGCDAITYYYDKADKLIFSQDGEQVTPEEWTFYLYDKVGRLVVQGTCKNSNTASVANSVVNVNFAPTGVSLGNSGYTSTFEITSAVVHLVNYYDNYGFREIIGFKNVPNFPDGTVEANGNLTGSIITVLDSNIKLYSAVYYDLKGNPLKKVSTNHMGGFDIITSTYNFMGKPLTTQHVHTATNKATQTQLYTYIYDAHTERLKKVTHKLNGGTAVTLADNTYDKFGRLSKTARKELASLTDNYNYNIRSWITSISGTQFTENLTYTPNGNIASMQWITDGKTHKYTYTYDPLSRIKTAAYTGPTTTEKYQTAYSYDPHGNIETIERYGKTTASAYGIVDKLRMTYTGNQLTNVTDAGTTVSLAESNDFKKGSTTNPGYAYNKNGAMTKDLNKNISSISYNSLSLPKSLTMISQTLPLTTTVNGAEVALTTGGRALASGSNITYSYTYAADGRKLKVVQGSNTRDYAGNIIYENGSLKRILVDGGYIEGGVYYFNLNDHLGNVRTVANASGTAVQRDHYYPFGLPMAVTTSAEQDKQPYKYNGKEFDRSNGLNWMDYGARHYDAALGRFTTMDPLAEANYSISPYAYCDNNPMKYIDIYGLTKYLAITMGSDVRYRGEKLANNDSSVEHHQLSGGINGFISILKQATNADSEGIGFISLWSHGSEGMIFAGGDWKNNSIRSGDLSKLKTAISNGEIVIAKNAIIYLGGCNAGTSDYGIALAQELANATGAIVIAANDKVGPKNETNGNMIYSTYHPRSNNFIQFGLLDEPLHLGPEIDVNHLLNQAKTMTKSILNSDMQPIKPKMTWNEFSSYLDNALKVNNKIKVTYQ